MPAVTARSNLSVVKYSTFNKDILPKRNENFTQMLKFSALSLSHWKNLSFVFRYFTKAFSWDKNLVTLDLLKMPQVKLQPLSFTAYT